MRYCYDKLWKLLVDNNMKKKDLQDKTGISSSTIAKMSKELPVSIEVLARICQTLNCSIEDIIEIHY